jgi:hypothetical protein
MGRVLGFVLVICLAPAFLGCGPERSKATEEEVMDMTSDPSKLLTPDTPPDPAAGGAASATPAAP